MLSIILYGRNDSYGYNLHKRAALSLNCMAELLGADGDEILFVDYNTPDDFPTFPEAIRDTLTARARRLLRVFRVRSALHRRFQDRTHLAVLEPVARNVALRRSNPANRWMLSTNTDMIFVPRTGRSLSEEAARLEDALYHTPRFELPETLWESLDRMDPGGTIAKMGQWGWTLHLNEIVRGSDLILYDSPGDFQLATRADLFGIDGFDERMLRGWHVDSNLARRLGFLYGRPRSLAEHFFGYHCDHTRQATPMHRHDRIENDWQVSVEGISQAAIPEQRERWGLASETIEEIKLGAGGSSYAGSLRAAIGEPMRELTKVAYRQESYDKLGYDARHVLPFLADALSCYPRTTTVGWIGIDAELLQRFTAAWVATGFTGTVQVPAGAPWLAAGGNPCCRLVALSELADAADAFVVDFGPRAGEGVTGTALAGRTHAARLVASWFRRLVAAERRRLEAEAQVPRRFIAVNAVHSQFESLVAAHVGAATAPIATRLRQGFVLPAKKEVRDLLPLLQTGHAGRKESTGFIALRGARGHAFYGGYFDLMEGDYRVRLRCQARHARPARLPGHVMVLEVVSGNYYLAFHPLSGAELSRGEVVLDFSVSEQFLFYAHSSRIEVRLLTLGLAEQRVTSVTLEELDTGPGASPATSVDWLPLMFVGSAGDLVGAPRRRRRFRRLAALLHRHDRMISAAATGVAARHGEDGCVVYGPYVSLLPGRYILDVELAPHAEQAADRNPDAGQVRLDVYCLVDDCILAEVRLPGGVLRAAEERLEFTVPDRLDRKGNPMQLEFRVFSSGGNAFVLRSVRTTPIALLPVERAAFASPIGEADHDGVALRQTASGEAIASH